MPQKWENLSVASLADAWIEIPAVVNPTRLAIVASLADAWIEIEAQGQLLNAYLVASLADAWIEISTGMMFTPSMSSRIPRGCVD